MITDGKNVVDVADPALTIRPMVAGDEAAVLAFADQLPVRDLLFLPRDIRHPKVVRAWVEELESGSYTTLLALEENVVIGCGTVAKDILSWSGHVAEIRCVLSPTARGRGVGSELIQATFRTALLSGAEKIIAQMTTDQASAMSSFEGLGFTPEAILRDHVKDEAGTPYDLVVLAHRVSDIAGRLETYGLGAD